MTQESLVAHPNNSNTLRQQAGEWRGDSFVQNPDVAWNLVTEFPIAVDDLWSGPRGITRIGPGNEGYAGYMLPSKLQGLVEDTKFAYMLPPTGQQSASLPKQLEVGTSITDGDGSEKLTVVELDNDARHMTFEASWVNAKANKPGLHYSWELHALAGDQPNTSLLLTRMRIEGLSHPKLWEKAGPLADRITMNLVRQGILEENHSPQSHRNKALGATALILGVAVAGSAVAKRRQKKT